VNIIKIGGGSSVNVGGILDDLKKLERPAVIVHGANAWRDELAGHLNRPIRRLVSESGRSSVYSDDSLLDLQLMAYAGLRNKRIVEMCQQRGFNAVGLTGLDGGLVRARRNPGIRIVENNRKRLVRDLSGKPEALNFPLLDYLLKSNYLPVITVPFLDERGNAVNSENDDLVSLLHRELQAQRIFFFIEAPGLLRDPLNNSSIIHRLTPPELETEITRSDGRMGRKLHALKAILAIPPVTVFICDGRLEHPVQHALNGSGTCISA